jgi:topoisomerase-4 subunit A
MAFSTLEKIFIREEMYSDFKLYSDRETLYEYLYKLIWAVYKKHHLLIHDEEIWTNWLTQIPMIRITRFDSDKADDAISKWKTEMEQVEHHL